MLVPVIDAGRGVLKMLAYADERGVLACVGVVWVYPVPATVCGGGALALLRTADAWADELEGGEKGHSRS